MDLLEQESTNLWKNFNKEYFSDLLMKAKDNMSITEYSKQSGVNRTYISKFLNKKIENPPSPDILKRLADAAYNDVTYEDLMGACGYLDHDNVINKALNKEYSFEEYMNTLGERLAYARECKDITQLQVQKDIQINHKTLSGYERNISEPDYSTLIKLADYYNVSLDFLLRGYHIKKPYKDIDLSEEYYLITKELQNEKINVETIRDFVKILKKEKSYNRRNGDYNKLNEV